MARQIALLEDEARFYEERANPWLRGMLTQQGATAFRTFPERHPEVSYITYEPRTGHQLAEWLSLALATVDIVVVDTSAPETIVQWIGELTRPHLHTFLFDPEGELATKVEQPPYVQWFRGICTSSEVADTLSISSRQSLITFGPGLQEIGQNGNATNHIDSTAEQLINRVVRVVDESLERETEDTPDNDGHSNPPSF
jgi:hypothetical protein